MGQSRMQIFNYIGSNFGANQQLELSSVTMPERNCGVIVLTGHEAEPATLIYGDYLLDEVLLGSGHVLEKAN